MTLMRRVLGSSHELSHMFKVKGNDLYLRFERIKGLELLCIDLSQ